MKKIFLLLVLSIVLYGEAPMNEDIQLYLDTESNILNFGGTTTPECKIKISSNHKFFEYIDSACKKMTNSKGVQIICNSNKSVCKTETEIHDYLNYMK